MNIIIPFNIKFTFIELEKDVIITEAGDAHAVLQQMIDDNVDSKIEEEVEEELESLTEKLAKVLA